MEIRHPRLLLRRDPDLPLLLSLENFDPETKRARKATIFHERTIQGPRVVADIKTAQDALLISLGERGRVDLEHVASLLKRRVADVVPELKGAIILNPQTDRWETEDEYLSGNVRAKLAAAEAAVLSDEQFQANIEALKPVQPVDLTAAEIDARLGSTWIPANDLALFVEELLGERGITINHVPQLGLWVVQAGWNAKSSVANTTEFGTDRRSALELIEDAMNLRTPTVYVTKSASGPSFGGVTDDAR